MSGDCKCPRPHRPKRPGIFRLNKVGSEKDLLLEVCLERGWVRWEEEEHEAEEWDLWWRNTAPDQTLHKELLPWQLINHIPRAATICRKDILVRHLRRMRNIYGSVYDFSPGAYVLPAEYPQLLSDHVALSQEEPIYISKPVGLSRGRGIAVFKDPSSASYEGMSVVQEYIKNPFLIGGHKFDLRLYVLVPCGRPLSIYIYQEGLVRFASEPFNLDELDNRYSHLTNSSINYLNPGGPTEEAGEGCKWTLSQLRHFFRQYELNDWLLWQRIRVLIILTLFSQANGMNNSSHTGTFELLGFDVLVDNTLKPWLLEVNKSPSLAYFCEIDAWVKKPMLHGMFDLLGLGPWEDSGISDRELRKWDFDYAKRLDSSYARNIFAKQAIMTQPTSDVEDCGFCLSKRGDDVSSSSSCASSSDDFSSKNQKPERLSPEPRSRSLVREDRNIRFAIPIPSHFVRIPRSRSSGDVSSRSSDECSKSEEIIGPNDTYFFKLIIHQFEKVKGERRAERAAIRYRARGKTCGPSTGGQCSQCEASQLRIWTKSCPQEVKGWVRAFPFNSKTRDVARVTPVNILEGVQEVKRFFSIVTRTFGHLPTEDEARLNEHVKKAMGPHFHSWMPS